MATQHNTSLVVPKSTLSRLPLYYSHIRKMQQHGEEYVSAAAVAKASTSILSWSARTWQA